MYVKQLEGIIEAAKCNLVSEGDKNTKNRGATKENHFELSISVPPLERVNLFGFNYDIKQNIQVWIELCIRKVTCSITGNLVGHAGKKEHT